MSELKKKEIAVVNGKCGRILAHLDAGRRPRTFREESLAPQKNQFDRRLPFAFERWKLRNANKPGSRFFLPKVRKICYRSRLGEFYVGSIGRRQEE
jgi:hypothetical protein